MVTRALAHGLLAGRCELQCVDCASPEEWCCHLHACGDLSDFLVIRVLKAQQFNIQAIKWALLVCFCYVYTMELEQKPRGLTPNLRPLGSSEVRWNTIYCFDGNTLVWSRFWGGDNFFTSFCMMSFTECKKLSSQDFDCDNLSPMPSNRQALILGRQIWQPKKMCVLRWRQVTYLLQENAVQTSWACLFRKSKEDINVSCFKGLSCRLTFANMKNCLFFSNLSSTSRRMLWNRARIFEQRFCWRLKNKMLLRVFLISESSPINDPMTSDMDPWTTNFVWLFKFVIVFIK